MAEDGRDISHDAARLYCNQLAQRLEATAPARYMNLVRAGKAQQAYLYRLSAQRRGTTSIGAYSPHAREGFPVAAPVTWAQV